MPDLLFGPTPHQEAIDFIKSKPVVTRDVFDGLLPELKARAFTITGIEGANVLQAVRDRIADLPAGHNWDDVKKDIVDDISPFMVNPDGTPKERDEQINAANRRAELLLRTHGFQAYQAASFQVMDRQKDVLPYWQYLTMEDDRVRPEHAALDQIVLPADHPFWQNHYPPWDWGCRCQVVPISQEDRDDLKDKDEKKSPDQQIVLEGPQAEQITHGRLVRDGRSYDVRGALEKEGGSGFSWHPGDLRIPLEQLKSRYDAATWGEFEAWARKTPLGKDQPTVWAWLGGKGQPPPVAGPEPTTALGLVEHLQKMRAKFIEAGAVVNEAFAAYKINAAAIEKEIAGTSDETKLEALYEKRNQLMRELAETSDQAQQQQSLILAQQRDLVRQPAANQSHLPVANHTAHVLPHLQAGLDLWRRYAAKAIDISAPLGVFGLTPRGRAYCDSAGIHLAPGDSASTVMHEVAHWIDRSHPKVGAANIAFLNRRTEGEKPVRLSKLTGNRSYGPDEVAKPDKFDHPYVGKIYTSPGASEIISMGIERLHRNPGQFAFEDADYCEHVLKTLRGETNS